MYGHTHFIRKNREDMRALFALLSPEEVNAAMKIGSYTESQLLSFLKKKNRDHFDDDEDKEEREEIIGGNLIEVPWCSCYSFSRESWEIDAFMKTGKGWRHKWLSQ